MVELSDKLKNLKGTQDLRQSFENVFDAITNGFDETLRGVMQGTARFRRPDEKLDAQYRTVDFERTKQTIYHQSYP
jgi:hypothetical protein